jgi:hypothetical protein
MKTLNSKTLIRLTLLALLISSNGCMTQSSIKYAEGHPEKAWMNNYFDNAAPPPDPKSKPHISYYFLLPLSAPADIATSPLQLIGYGFDCMLAEGIAHEGGGTP